MDFKEQVRTMLAHLESDPTDQAFDDLMTALGTGVATLIGSAERPEQLMKQVFTGIATAAFAAHAAANATPKTALQVLEDFQPGGFNG